VSYKNKEYCFLN